MPAATTFGTVRTSHWYDRIDRATASSRALVLLGRILFAAIFLGSMPGHFKPETVAYAESAGVPVAFLLVPLSGILALIGGLSVLLGYRARLGAWLLIAFLVPVTLAMHAFWDVADAGARQMQLAHFMKNTALIGGAMLIAHFGAGPLSLDARRRRR